MCNSYLLYVHTAAEDKTSNYFGSWSLHKAPLSFHFSLVPCAFHRTHGGEIQSRTRAVAILCLAFYAKLPPGFLVNGKMCNLEKKKKTNAVI